MAREKHPDLPLHLSQVPLDRMCVPSGYQTPAVLLPIHPGDVYSQELSIGQRVHLPHFHSSGYTTDGGIYLALQL